MASILDTHRPEALLDQLDTAGLVDAALDGTGWSPERLQAVDYILYCWQARFVAGQDARSVAELQAAIGRLLERGLPPAPYADRWRALDDALEARRLTLVARDARHVTGMKHVRRILDHLRDSPGTRQGDLLQQLELGVSVSRLSQIVSLMEANGLIDIAREGRESFLSLSAGATERDRTPAAADARASGAPRERTTRSLLASRRPTQLLAARASRGQAATARRHQHRGAGRVGSAGR